MSALGVQSAPALVERVSSVERAEGVGLSGANGFVAMTASELKASLASSRRRGVVLDIDETLSATNVAWFERLADIFGNPGGESVDVLIRRFHLAQHVPFWQTPEALEWMQRQRDDPKAQDDLPLIGGAVEGAHALMRHVPVVGYCTVRPCGVNANTIKWLRENGFPDLPVVAKPTDVPFADGNKWKARVLWEMWPEVRGIVDDNPKVPILAGVSYPGNIFLFGHSSVPEGAEHATPCATWPVVVETARTLFEGHANGDAGTKGVSVP